jgi:1D-myo-inositol 3-kinase
MKIPHFVSIGHITHDLVGNGITPGGPALYSTCTARNLGAPTGMITSFSRPLLHPFLLHGIEICCKESQYTTTFANLYSDTGERRQLIESVADQIEPDQVPKAWRSANIVNLCPVANEYRTDIVHLFDQALIGVCPQGWMRRWDNEGHVFRKNWDSFKEVLPYVDLVFFSEEDVANPEEVVQTYLAYVKLVVVTRGKRGANVYFGQEEHHVPAFQAIEIDPTGAGDVFATAFLMKYFETRDPLESARFANCVASFVVEKEGIYGIPSQKDVAQRLKTQTVIKSN